MDGRSRDVGFEVVSRANGKASRDLGTFIFPKEEEEETRLKRERERDLLVHILSKKRNRRKARARGGNERAPRREKDGRRRERLHERRKKCARRNRTRVLPTTHNPRILDRSVQFNEHPLGNRLEHEERDVLPLELRFRDLGVTRDSSRRDIDNSKEGIFGGIERV